AGRRVLPRGGGVMRIPIALKIFGIALGLLILMATVAVLSMQMTRTVDGQLAIIDQNYFPAYVALAQANIQSVEESAYLRRLLLALGEGGDNAAKIDQLRTKVTDSGKTSDERIADARRYINRQIADPLDFDDNIALARLDDKIGNLQEERQRYEAILGKLLTAADAGDKPLTRELLGELDEWRDDFDHKIDAARNEMHRLAGAAIVGTRAYQQRVVTIGVALLAIAALLGLTFAAAVTLGLVRPVRRLLLGTAAVENGALDTVVPVTSRDEIGSLTRSFNSMVGELRIKAQIRDTFGKYVDPRIVAGLLDRPELTDAKGSRRDMSVLFCDMKGFTAFSEGLTPAALVNVLNRYMTVMSEPVRRNNGIIDKYIGDGIMAFWGPPFTGDEEHAGLACLTGLGQLADLTAFRAELPELIGLRRGFPEIDVRIGIATGDVVVGNIGSERTRNYTVIGDTVNLASRLESANKTYGTRALINETTNRFAANLIETREIDHVLVVGKTEPQRVFELLGRKGEVDSERLALREAFHEALAAYRQRDWQEARRGFENCLEIMPGDGPSKVFLGRITKFCTTAPDPDWDSVWSLVEK
ncbi:MAG TPA: adenylate/guanylate cyclase domain-containing protein, partial [Stellaceae bacterium]|nr:adenylate/guanylate cyclase domain-containing protein [Stellaceae bacterium]